MEGTSEVPKDKMVRVLKPRSLRTDSVSSAVFLGVCVYYGQQDEGWMVAVYVEAVLCVLWGLALLWSSRLRELYLYNMEFGALSTLHEGEHVVSYKRALHPIRREGDRVYFVHRGRRFWLNDDLRTAQRARPPLLPSLATMRSTRGLASDEAHAQLLAEYGPNRYEIPIPRFLSLLSEQLAAPFFAFQIFCVLLWMLDDYWYYSLFTLFLLLLVESTVAQSRLMNLAQMRTMTVPERKLWVRRAGRWLEVGSYSLVPGDLVSLHAQSADHLICPADMVLVSGTAVVDEAMLTGESVPVRKEALLVEESAPSRKEHTPDSVTSLQKEPSSGLDALPSESSLLRAGTKIVQAGKQETSSTSGKSTPLEAAERGAWGLVLRTGFDTAQGGLIRTIMDSTDHVTANTREAFAFIAILLVFALTAAAYVWNHGHVDETTPRGSAYHLLLHCVLIVTSVVPPELPLELGVAVNASLLALKLMGVFCTQPFRIPKAGQVTLVAFDKTGTLTESQLRLEGVAGRHPTQPTSFSAAPGEANEAEVALAGCHSLMPVDGKPAGDPTEVAILNGLGWQLKADESVQDSAGHLVRVLKRFPFSGQNKRMAAVLTVDGPALPSKRSLVAVKGAPEAVRDLLVSVPNHYDATAAHFASMGRRVLAVATRRLAKGESVANRADAERRLSFAGFVVLRAAAKPDSAAHVAHLRAAGFRCVMLTGDHLQTAVHVAAELGLVEASQRVLCASLDANSLVTWHSVRLSGREDPSALPTNLGDALNVSADAIRPLQEDALAISGEVLEVLENTSPDSLAKWLPQICVWARMNPAQKERAIQLYNAAGESTVMCGDGTNDVGALKAADVGLALLNAPPLPPALRRPSSSSRSRPTTVSSGGGATRSSMLAAAMEEAAESSTVVRLGDASIAAPFTARGSSIGAVLDILRQGRCTLVTTHQMFTIYALNSLLHAYSLSVLFLMGVRMSELQSTVSSMAVAFLFLLLSRTKPLPHLANVRPPRSVLSWRVATTVLSQFGLHMAVMAWVLSETGVHLLGLGSSGEAAVSLTAEFSPSRLNSVVFLLSTLMNVTNFVVNYRGRPFMEGLLDNIPLRNLVGATLALLVVLASGWFPDLNAYFEVVPMPDRLHAVLCSAMLIDLTGCALLDRLSHILPE